MESIIALLTDFGIRGQHYVAAMKAVILKINPLAKIIDISHNISPYSTIEASYLLKSTYKHFPKETVFIIVIDPGVGSTREIVIVKTKSNFYFVGPNNGILPNVLDSSEISECINVQNEEYFNHPVSPTFHGRDIMAPIGAFITKKIDVKDFGPNFNVDNLVKNQQMYKLDLENNQIFGSIQYIDSFGNCTTTIPMERNKIKNSDLMLKVGSEISIKIFEQNYKGEFVSHFSSVHPDSLLFLVGSSNCLEVSINQGSASERLGLKVGDKIMIKL
jgi:S-adenosylmethionine hydrolase